MHVISVSNLSNSKSNFKGLKPDVARNQMKILLTQDIWAPSLKVKMPETELEKEVLLEILNFRAQLDRYTRLTNEKLKLKTLMRQLANLKNNDPSNPEISEITEELKSKGNLDSYLKTLDKNIELERNKRKPAITYFKDIERLSDDYEDRKLIRDSLLNKFWSKIKKNNINPNENMSTKELIKLVSENKQPDTLVTAQQPAFQLSKKQLTSLIQQEYEQMLRKGVDVFMGQGTHNMVAADARKALSEKYASNLKRFPELGKQLIRLYESVEKKYTFKVDRLVDIDIFPIGEIWKDMIADEKSMKAIMNDISNIKSQLSKNMQDDNLKNQLSAKEHELDELRKIWLERLKCSVKYEAQNREFMSNSNRLPEYEYLTGENKTIIKHKKFYDAYKKNDEKLPEEMWEEVLK